jgi:Fur family peroxide stress response transcriptional regulator
VIDLEMDSIDGVTDIAAKNFNGNISGHITYFYGSCDQCTKVMQE